MQVSNPNNVKIYNLSAGKTLPEWISEKKRRTLQKNNVDIRRRIELIQDFEMPGVSTSIQVTKDGQYILATGIYKPRIRCFDVHQLSMKFERCFDSEIVTFELLSEDYSKIVFLQCDRYVEFHAQYGKYYRTRIPKFGRDMSYHYPSCDLYLVGASSEVYRLNLEQGRFLNPLVTDASQLNVCQINPVHHLFMCGSIEGKVEAWDPRSRQRAGILDCAFNCVTQETEILGMPSVTSLVFKDGLTMAVGTATGQILLYDIRSDKPLLVKDHLYGLPIMDVEFHNNMDIVISMDTKIVKLWDRNNGKAFTSIEPGMDLNDLCLVPDTGMMFIANEEKKILTYYIPSLGPAPRWSSFLDNLTEELEENQNDTVYDDYKFVTKKEIEELGLTHLIGSNLLRAYMHGYFMDVRLYRKAKSIVQPFAYEEFRKKKIREKIEEDRANRVKLKTLPKVNRELAMKLIENSDNADKKTKETVNLMKDDRFKALFENPDFQIDEQSEEFRLLNPVVSKLDKDRKKKLKKQELMLSQFEEVEEKEGRPSSAEESEEESSSDDDVGWTKEVKRQHKLLKHESRLQRRREDEEAKIMPRFYELKGGEEFSGINKQQKKINKASLEERLAREAEKGEVIQENKSSIGNREMTFVLKKTKQSHFARLQAERQHAERKKIVRSAKGLSGKKEAWKS